MEDPTLKRETGVWMALSPTSSSGRERVRCCSALQWTMPPCPTPSQTQELAVPFLCLETPGSNSSLPTRLKSGSKSLP